MLFFEREVQSVFHACCAEYPIVLVTGMRQVGKTTMLEHLSGGSRRIVTLDFAEDRALAKEDPEFFPSDISASRDYRRGAVCP